MTLNDILISAYSDVCIMDNVELAMIINYRYSACNYVSKELLDKNVIKITASNNRINVWLE